MVQQRVTGRCYARLFPLGVVSLTLEQSQHKELEKDIVVEKRELKVTKSQMSICFTGYATQVELKEMELAHQEAVKELKLVCYIFTYLLKITP